MLKSCFLKQRPRIIKYRDYAKFGSNKFRDELVKELSFKSSHVNHFEKFIYITQNVLNKIALKDVSRLRNNESPLITKNLHKFVLARPRLLGKYRIAKTNVVLPTKKKKFVCKIIKKDKKRFLQ